MAILKAPLFSFGASGKLADALVFMKWKGLNDVRKYVIPTNPQTAAQNTQRLTYFKAGVTKWHTFTLTALDLAAWSLLASTCISKIKASVVGCMSNFNAFMRYFVDGIRADPTSAWDELSHVAPENTFAGRVHVLVTKCKLDNTLKLYWGTSKTYMPTAVDPLGGAADDSHAFNIDGCTIGVKYYFYIKATAALHYARTGIYSQIVTM